MAARGDPVLPSVKGKESGDLVQSKSLRRWGGGGPGLARDAVCDGAQRELAALDGVRGLGGRAGLQHLDLHLPSRPPGSSSVS